MAAVCHNALTIRFWICENSLYTSYISQIFIFQQLLLAIMSLLRVHTSVIPLVVFQPQSLTNVNHCAQTTHIISDKKEPTLIQHELLTMIIVQCSNVIDQGHKCQNKCIGPTRSSAWQSHCILFLPLLAFGLIGQNESG